MRKFNSALITGLGLLAFMVGAAIAGLCLDPYPAHELARAMQPPTLAHPFGCDPYGVDVFHRVLVGAWLSLSTATVVTIATAFIGLAFGTGLALASARAHAVLSRIVDCLMAFPGLLLAILLAAVMPQSEGTLLIALIATRWTGQARFCEGLVMKTLNEPFIESARSMGASPARIIVRHVWPAATGQLLIQAALSMSYVVLAEASLSFLGLGGGSGSSWGRLIAEGREYLIEAPHLSIFPGVVLVMCALSFALIAEGLRKYTDLQ